MGKLNIAFSPIWLNMAHSMALSMICTKLDESDFDLTFINSFQFKPNVKAREANQIAVENAIT